MPTMRHRLARHIQDRSTEWLSGMVMISWGWTLFLPGDTLAGPAFAAFRRFDFTEETWAGVFLGAGVLRLVMLFINGRWPKTPLFRMVLSAFGATSWLHVSFLLYQSHVQAAGPMGTGPGVYAILALFDLISVFRASVDVRYYESR